MALGNPYGAMARCIMNPDLTIEYFLDPNDSTKKMDGSTVDWAQVESQGQNCMVQIPKFYSCKKYDSATQAFYFGVSSIIKDTPFISSNDWVMNSAFFRDRSKACDDQSIVPVEVNYRYYGAFEGWIDAGSKLRSLPNKTPTTNKTLAVFRAAAKTMGLGFTQLDWQLLTAVQMLYITEYNNPDSQTMIGRGYVDANTSPLITGSTMSKGNNTYGETTGKSAMVYRGIENLYGNVKEFLENIAVGYYGNQTAATFFTTSNNWKTSNALETSTTQGSWNIFGISKNSAEGFIPILAGTPGGLYDLAYLGDMAGYYSGHSNSVASPWCGVTTGGCYTDGSNAGIFNFYTSNTANAAGAAAVTIGARLCV